MKKSIKLPDKVNLELAINILNLEKLPVELALNIIISYSTSRWLNIYFNKEVEGLPHNYNFGKTYDSNDELIDWEPIDTTLIKKFQSSISKRIVTAHHSRGDDFMSVLSWEVADETFVAFDAVMNQIDTVNIPLSDIYILKEDLREFDSGLAQNIPSSSSKPTNEMKALALIARKLAETKPKFQSGKKVNASSFKDYLVGLADDYEVSTSGLKSIDDKLNRALIHFELNNINKSQ